VSYLLDRDRSSKSGSLQLRLTCKSLVRATRAYASITHSAVPKLRVLLVGRVFVGLCPVLGRSAKGDYAVSQHMTDEICHENECLEGNLGDRAQLQG
jgi:hypothetical protein